MVSDSDFDYLNTDAEKVLYIMKTRFKYGFREKSIIDTRKFICHYCEIYGPSAIDDESKVVAMIRPFCVDCGGIFFHPDLMAPLETINVIRTYIESSFEKGVNAVYYEAIYTHFKNELMNTLIDSSDKLRALLHFYLKDKMYFRDNEIVREIDIKIDPLEEIRAIMINQKTPVDINYIHSQLSHLPISTIKNVLLNNDEFIQNGLLIFFHSTFVDISSHEISMISDIFSKTIGDHSFISTKELYDGLNAKLPFVCERNPEITDIGWREYLKTKFSDIYSFNGSVITTINSDFSTPDAFVWFTRCNKEFNLEQLSEFANSIGMQIYFDPVYVYSIRISKDWFVSKEMITFDVEKIDDVLNMFCKGVYSPLSIVDEYSSMPECGYPWNIFLLEQYVSSYSKKFMLIHRTYAKMSANGAIVRRNSGISNMDELIVKILIDSDVELQKAQVLDFLAVEGYISRRAYDGIEALIIEATAKRIMKR